MVKVDLKEAYYAVPIHQTATSKKSLVNAWSPEDLGFPDKLPQLNVFYTQHKS